MIHYTFGRPNIAGFSNLMHPKNGQCFAEDWIYILTLLILCHVDSIQNPGWGMQVRAYLATTKILKEFSIFTIP